MKLGIQWEKIKNHKTQVFSSKRVLIFSPVYPDGDAMRYRLVDASFVKICSEATHWAPTTPPEE